MAKGGFGRIPRERIQWYPSIDPDRCSGCGVCVEFCHQSVFSQNESVEVVRPYSCVVGCTGCAGQCPSQAISFPSLVDLREMLKKLRLEFPADD